MKDILNNDFLIIGAHFAVVYVIAFVTFLFYKEMTRPKHVTFLEIFRYMEDVSERLTDIMKEENEALRRKLFEQELRNYERIKRKLDDNRRADK